MKNTELKVLVVGCEPQSRRTVVDALAQVEGLQVVSTATSGPVAMARLNRLDVDMVILDMETADNEALDTLSGIHREFPQTAIVVMGGPDFCGAGRMVKALEMGAVDFIARPGDDPISLKDFMRQTRVLAGMLQSRMSFRQSRNSKVGAGNIPSRENFSIQKDKPSHRPELQPEKTSSAFKDRITQFQPPRIDAVVIGISTGGPNALLTFIPALKGDLGVPIFLVQHMPKEFTAPLAESLNKRSSLSVKEAAHDEIIVPGTVYIAPGGRHMVVYGDPRDDAPESRPRIGLNDDPPVNSCRPSADVLFSSVARAYGRHVLALVMTGMGGDGMQGTRDVRERGGYCISQSDDTCVVYGMPRSVQEAGLSNETVPLDHMAQRVMRLVRGRGGDGP